MRWFGQLVAIGLAAACAPSETEDSDSLESGTTTGTGASSLLDSDGDGYLDVEEEHAGSDPHDAQSVIYEGGWPYNMDKDAIADPGWDSKPAVGVIMPSLVGVDQFGDQLDIYDFAGHDRLILFELSTEWCAPCKAVASWLDGETDVPLQGDKPYTWWDDSYTVIRDKVDSGEIYWISVLYEDEDGENTNLEVVQRWYADYPNPDIPVMADADKEMHTWIKPSGIPNVNLLDSDMTMLTYSTRGLNEAFDLIVEMER